MPKIRFLVCCFQFHVHVFQLLLFIHSKHSLYLSLQFLISVLILPLASLFYLIAAKVSSDIHFVFFCDFTHTIVSLATSSRTVLVPFHISFGVTSSCAASNLLVTSAANCTTFSSLSTVCCLKMVLARAYSWEQVLPPLRSEVARDIH